MGGAPEAPQSTIDARVLAWRRALDPQALWPETTPAARVAAYREIWNVTARVLAGVPATLNGNGPDAARAMGVAAFVSGMGPLLGFWLERGTLAADASLRPVLAEHLAHGRRRHAVMKAHFDSVIAALGARGVSPVVLKGMHTAAVYFEDPGTRPSADIDLLISPAEAERAAAALRDLGLVQIATHTRPHREDWGPPGPVRARSIELTHADNPWSVDLHQTLDRTYFAGFTAGLGDPDPSMVMSWATGAGNVRVLRQPALTAFLALHAGSDLPEIQLIRIVELIVVLRADLAAKRLAWTDLAELLERTGTRRLAFPALQLAATLAPDVVDPSLLTSLRAETTRRMRHAVDTNTRVLPYHLKHRSLELRLVWAKGWRQVALNLADWVFPRGEAVSVRTRLKIWRHRVRLLWLGRMTWRARATGADDTSPAETPAPGDERDS